METPSAVAGNDMMSIKTIAYMLMLPTGLYCIDLLYTKLDSSLEVHWRTDEVPVPRGARELREQTFLYSSNSDTIGRLVYEIKNSESRVSGFYKQNLAARGWILKSVLEGKSLALAFSREDKELGIRITPCRFPWQRTEIEVELSPRESHIMLTASIPTPELQPHVQTPPTVHPYPGTAPVPLDSSELETIYFDFDSFLLRSEALAPLKRNAQRMMRAPNTIFQVAGHCDERGSRVYNFRLGEKRAIATRERLVLLGVPGEKLITISYGEELPLLPGSDEYAWSFNRRAEIGRIH